MRFEERLVIRFLDKRRFSDFMEQMAEGVIYTAVNTGLDYTSKDKTSISLKCRRALAGSRCHYLFSNDERRRVLRSITLF